LKERVIGTLLVIYDLGEISQRLRLYGAMVLVMLIAAGLIAFLASSRLRDFIVKPILELASAATRVSRTRDYGVRALKLSGDELGVLVDSFNEMLRSIQSRDDNLNRALSDRELALNDARSTRDSLRTTLASIGDAVVATDSNGSVVFANPVAQRLLQYAEAEMIGRPLNEFYRLIDEESGVIITDPLSQALSAEGVSGRDGSILVVRDGGQIPVDDSASPIRNEQNEITGTVLIFRDITLRRQQEAALRAAREQLQLVTDTMASAVTRCDRDHRYVWVSRQYSSWLQIPHEQFAGRQIVDIVGDNAYRAILPNINRVLTGERVQYEAQVDYRGIGPRWIRGTYVPTHDRAGTVDGWVAEISDITALKQAQADVVSMNEELRRSNQDLARSNDDLERFAYIASHDLQEPLRMIATYSQLLIRGYASKFDGDASMYVSNIVDSTRRMRTLLADLLAYTEVRAEDEMPAEPIDLNAVLENVKQNLRAGIEETGAEVACETLPTIQGHEAHFISLLQNLVGNAIKYRSNAPPRIRISMQAADSRLVLAVSDNGVGIAPEYHDTVFIPFKRLHGRSIPGSGIGLAICQRVVEKYAGRIWVESELGAGSTFLISLPKTIVVTREESNEAAV